MRSKYIFYITLILLTLLSSAAVPNQSYAQKAKKVSIKKQNKKNRDVKGREEETEDQMKQVEDELTKRHLKLQDKATRKRMKQTKKKSKRLKANKKDPFYKRWFRKKWNWTCILLTLFEPWLFEFNVYQGLF